MVDGPLRLPRRIGRQAAGRCPQGQCFQKFVDRPGICLRVEITHHDQMPAAVELAREEAELLQARALSQGKVDDRDVQPVETFAVTHEQCSAARNDARQAMFLDRIGLESTEKTVTRVGYRAHLAVGLMTPEGHAGLRREVAGLIDES